MNVYTHMFRPLEERRVPHVGATSKVPVLSRPRRLMRTCNNVGVCQTYSTDSTRLLIMQVPAGCVAQVGAMQR